MNCKWLTRPNTPRWHRLCFDRGRPEEGSINQPVSPVKSRLRVEVVPLPNPDAARGLDAVLDLLAAALAERCIVQARAEVAAELGVVPETLDREIGPFASPLRRFGMAGAREGA